MEIYQPAEDSYLLKDAIEKFLLDKNRYLEILEIGSGSGIIARSCKNLGFDNITVTEINDHAIKSLKKEGFKTIKSDLFEKIKNKFDIIIFNPPYLPLDSSEPIDSRAATTGGSNGNEMISRFLLEARTHLKKDGKIFLLFSTLSKPRKIIKQIKENNQRYQKVAEKKLFFEKLQVYMIYF